MDMRQLVEREPGLTPEEIKRRLGLGCTRARMTIGAAAKTRVFYDYVREALASSRRQGDIVAMNTLGAHKNVRSLA